MVSSMLDGGCLKCYWNLNEKGLTCDPAISCYETGHEALVVMLRGSRYRNLTLLEASQRYVKEDPGHGPKIGHHYLRPESGQHGFTIINF